MSKEPGKNWQRSRQPNARPAQAGAAPRSAAPFKPNRPKRPSSEAPDRQEQNKRGRDGRVAMERRESDGAKRPREPVIRARDDGRVLLYGLHAVEAALANPGRKILSLKVTANAKLKLADAIAKRELEPRLSEAAELDRQLPRDAVHQGVVLETEPLDFPDLRTLSPESHKDGRRALVLVLDQVTDPHNVGAILRSAAAFGAAALIMTARNSPPLDGVLAKAASGGLEAVPVITVTNLARALEQLAEIGYFRIGLDGSGTSALEDADAQGPLAIVLGAESTGMRRLTVEHCDQVCRISTTGSIGSLNVSNAAAIALHSIRSRQR